MYINEVVGDERVEDLDSQIEIVLEVWDELANLVENQGYEELNDIQRYVYVVNELFMEVNNGGFNQYFFNSAGDHAIEALDALDEMSFYKIAELLEKALSLFENGYIHDQFARQDYLVGENEDEIDSKCSALDSEFYAINEDVDQQLYDYIYSNKEMLDA